VRNNTNVMKLLSVEKKEVGEFGYSPTMERLWNQDYDRVPVGIREFVESEDFIGRSVSSLEDVWKTELDEIFSPGSNIVTLILTGAIGTGKTTVANVCLLYKMYLLSCLKDPASFYGLLPGTKIVFGCFNITLRRTETGYDTLKSWLDTSPYFKNYCPRRTRPDEPIFFPSKNISYEIGSLDTHALGEHIFSFVMDEANFFKRTPDPSEKSRAHQLYSQARARLISRYMYAGEIPGICILISSRKVQTSFLEEQIGLADKDPQFSKVTKVVSMSLWEAKPGAFTGKTFSVAVGDESADSRILEEDEVAPGFRVIEVPVKLKPQFVEDIDGSLMNLAGESIVGSFSFFTSRNSIVTAIDYSRHHPFDSIEISDIGVNTRVLGSASASEISNHFDLRRICRIALSKWTLLSDPGIVRVAHVDIGLTNDALGLAVGHISYQKGGEYKVVLDIIIRIRAKAGEEIDLEEIVKFFVYLRKNGIPVSTVSFDRFESRFVIQQLSKLGFQTGLLSLKLDHYKLFRRLLFEGRISYYDYQPLLEEMIDLRKGVDDKRPNHPSGGSDDVCDAVCGVLVHCCGVDPMKREKGNNTSNHLVPLIVRGHDRPVLS